MMRGRRIRNAGMFLPKVTSHVIAAGESPIAIWLLAFKTSTEVLLCTTPSIFWVQEACTTLSAPVLSVLIWIVYSQMASADMSVAVFTRAQRRSLLQSCCICTLLPALTAFTDICVEPRGVSASCPANTLYATRWRKQQGPCSSHRTVCSCA